jgi:hypothetical protein
MIDRHYGQVARDGREHAIRLLNEPLSAANVHGGRWWTLRGRRRLRPPPAETTEPAAKQVKARSPLTDSNRRPPPYHGGFELLLCGAERRLIARFPCDSPGFLACSTPSLKVPEVPRHAWNLSPEPSPNGARLSRRSWQHASVLAGVRSGVLPSVRLVAHRGSQASAARGWHRRPRRACALAV